MLILPILAIVLISGCLGPSDKATPGAGVVINAFDSDFDTVDSGQRVSFDVRVENTGRRPAENVIAKISGIDPALWQLSPSAAPLGRLVPVDIEQNTPGGAKTARFKGVAQNLQRGSEFTFHPRALVEYDYTTKIVKSIELVDLDELRRLKLQGRGLNVGTKDTTGGPLSVEIKAADIATSGNDDTFSLSIEITNTQWEQGGTLVDSNPGDDRDFPVQMRLRLPSQLSLTNSGAAFDECTSGAVDLWRGKSAQITCEVRAGSNPNPGSRTTVLVEIELSYKYRAEKEASIRVLGKGQ